MKQLLGFLLIACALIEGSIVSFPLTLTLATSFAINWPNGSILWLFTSAILLDMFTPRTWGASAIFFLAMAVLLKAVSAKMSGRGIIFYAVFIAIVQLSYSVVFAGGINASHVVGGTILGVTVTVLSARFGTPETDAKRLAV